MSKSAFNTALVEHAKEVFEGNTAKKLNTKEKQIQAFFDTNTFTYDQDCIAKLVGVLTGYTPFSSRSIQQFGVYSTRVGSKNECVINMSPTNVIGYGFSFANPTNYIQIPQRTQLANIEDTAEFLAKLTMYEESLFTWLTKYLSGYVATVLPALGIDL